MIRYAVLFVFLSVVFPAGAATITVDTETDEFDATPNATCSLREAVESANSDADFGGCVGNGAYGADSIVLPSGTYGLTLAPPEAFLDLDNAVGDLDVQGDSLEILGEGSATTTITRPGAMPFGILQADFDIPLILADLTVSEGESVAGAGIFADGNLTLDGVVVRDNLARAPDAGGAGIVAFAALTISDSVIANNQVYLEDPCDSGPPTTGGGIIALNFGSVLIERSTVSNNTVTGDPGCQGIGGGLGMLATPFASARVVNSTFSGNSAAFVGGVDILFEGIPIGKSRTSRHGSRKSRITRRPADWVQRFEVSGTDPHLVVSPSDAIGLEHVTIAGNSADEIGGLSLLSSGESAPAIIENTLIGINTAANAPDCSVSGLSVTSQGVNLLSVGDPLSGESACLSSPSNLVGTLASPVDPLLGPLQDNGGPTPTRALGAGSPAFDAAPDQGQAEDQRGFARPQGAAHDIGAYESLAADIQVTKTNNIDTVIPGTQIGYTITVSNAGPSDDPAVALTDTLPGALTCDFTSTASGGATGNTAAGSGDLNETLSMPAGSSVTYDMVCDVASGATGTLSNTAAATASGLDSNGANNSASDDDNLVAARRENVPALGGAGLGMLLLALTCVAGFAVRVRRAS